MYAFVQASGAGGGATLGANTFTGNQTIASADPYLIWSETDAGTDLKNWRAGVSAGVFTLSTRTDADGTGKVILAVTRGATTAIGDIAIGNATDNPTGSWLGTGMFTFGGGVTTNALSTVTGGTAPNNGLWMSAANTVIVRSSAGNTATFSAAAITLSAPTDATGLLSARVGAAVRKGIVTISSTERAKVGGSIYTNTTTTGNTAATETDAFSHSVTGNTLGADGESLEFEAAGTFAATASVDKQVKVVYGATTLFDTGALAVTGGADWYLNGTIVRTGAATQKAVVRFTSSFASFTSSVDYATPTATLSGAVTMKLTVNGTNANDTVAEFYKENWRPFQ